MTLILSCITREYVVQVSDRRLVDLASGKPCKNDENKAVDFSGQMGFGYTGLANLGTMRTDLWLVNTLLGSLTISEAVRAIQEKATVCFRNIVTRKPEWKRHAFIGAGRIKLSPSDPLRPTIALISNFHTEDGSELARPQDAFAAKIWMLEDSAPRDFFVVAVGAAVGQAIARRLNRALASAVKRGKEVGPEPLLRLLVIAARQVATACEQDGDKSVGKDLLAVSIPKAAVESSFVTMPDGSPAVYSLSTPPLRNARSFLAIPENRIDGISYGPNFVYGGTAVGGYFSSAGEGSGSLEVGVGIMALEPGAKAGSITLEDGRSGHFISRPLSRE